MWRFAAVFTASVEPFPAISSWFRLIVVSFVCLLHLSPPSRVGRDRTGKWFVASRFGLPSVPDEFVTSFVLQRRAGPALPIRHPSMHVGHTTTDVGDAAAAPSAPPPRSPPCPPTRSSTRSPPRPSHAPPTRSSTRHRQARRRARRHARRHARRQGCPRGCSCRSAPLLSCRRNPPRARLSAPRSTDVTTAILAASYLEARSRRRASEAPVPLCRSRRSNTVPTSRARRRSRSCGTCGDADSHLGGDSDRPCVLQRPQSRPVGTPSATA